MFYETSRGHGLAADPIKAIVAPRPIGWISTIDASGRHNLAPYSFFSVLGTRPPILCFSSEGMKHSASNARTTGEFVANLATMALAEQVRTTSRAVGPEVDEFELAELVFAPSRLVRPARVAASPAAMECRVLRVIELADLAGHPTDRHLVIGQVVGVHIDDAYLRDGRFDTAAARPLARCGYNDYAVVTELFEMAWPD